MGSKHSKRAKRIFNHAKKFGGHVKRTVIKAQSLHKKAKRTYADVKSRAHKSIQVLPPSLQKKITNAASHLEQKGKRMHDQTAAWIKDKADQTISKTKQFGNNTIDKAVNKYGKVIGSPTVQKISGYLGKKNLPGKDTVAAQLHDALNRAAHKMTIGMSKNNYPPPTKGGVSEQRLYGSNPINVQANTMGPSFTGDQAHIYGSNPSFFESLIPHALDWGKKELGHLFGSNPVMTNNQHIYGSNPIRFNQHIYGSNPMMASNQHIYGSNPMMASNQHIYGSNPAMIGGMNRGSIGPSFRGAHPHNQHIYGSNPGLVKNLITEVGIPALFDAVL